MEVVHAVCVTVMETDGKKCDWCGCVMYQIDRFWHGFWRCRMGVWLCSREECSHEVETVDREDNDLAP
jgi:Zn-finger protein